MAFPLKTGLAAAVLAASVSVAVAGEVATSAADGLVLDETTPCRFHIQFGMDRLSSEQLKAEGAAYLDAKSLEGLKRENKQIFKYLGRDKDWRDDDWMGEVYALFSRFQSSQDRGEVDAHAYTAPPPADWMKPEFDDSSWGRQRMPMMMGVPASTGRNDIIEALGRRGGCFRFRFSVPDAARAGGLTLQLVFRGGVRAFVNGQEIGRGGLPEGPVAADAPGADYPAEAYLVLGADGAPVKPRLGKYTFASDLYGKFDEIPPPDREHARFAATHRFGLSRDLIDRPNWERIQKARDRVLGPLDLPEKLLRQGTNVLALEVRSSRLHPVTAADGQTWRRFCVDGTMGATSAWSHGQIVSLRLAAPGGKLPSMLTRPPEVQVRVEDMHTRMIDRDFYDPGGNPGTIRFVGANNGTFSAQVVVGTDRELRGVKVTVGALKADRGAAGIPAAAIGVFSVRPQPLVEMIRLGWGGNGPDFWKDPLNIYNCNALKVLRAYGPGGPLKVNSLSRDDKIRLMEQLKYHEQLGEPAAESIPADSVQPFWLSLKVPADAVSGMYRGSLTVEAQGLPAVTVPIEAQVHDWRVPDPRDFQTVLGIEQSPYGVARHYKVPLWSDEHFKLLEKSFRELGRAGNDYLFIPVLQYMEFGNLDDTMIKWTRKKDGTFEFDFKYLDRYLDAATKFMGRPRVICFAIMFGAAGNPPLVPCLNEAGGKSEVLDMSAKSPCYRRAWLSFGRALYEFMKQKGLLDAMYWGYKWDGEADPELAGMLATLTPDVRWASGGHGYASPSQYKACSFIYMAASTQVRSLKGWKRSDILVLDPRFGGSVLGLNGFTLPFEYRVVSERALVAGANGVGRMGADYWAGTFMNGLKDPGYLRPGMPVSYLLWPGRDGAESSPRYEALLEGVQETEARIFVEQALERKCLPEELAKRAESVLFEHQRATLFIPSFTDMGQYSECTMGWQERSAALFALAAEVARTAGFDVGTQVIAEKVPARGSRTCGLKLRNWTSRARQWKVASDQAWIVPEAGSGQLDGQKDLAVTLNASQLEPGKAAKGRLTVTDATGNREFTVEVVANVAKVFDFISPTVNADRKSFLFIPDDGKVPFNVTAGGNDTQEVTVFNRCAVDVPWRATASVPWVKVEPAAGKAAGSSPMALRITAAPPGETDAYHDVTVTVAEENGSAREEVPLAVHVMRPYQRPALPPGEAVPMTPELHKALLKGYLGADQSRMNFYHPEFIDETTAKTARDKAYARAIHVRLNPCFMTYKLEGVSAFSAEVGFPRKWYGYEAAEGPETMRISAEIYVDGVLKAQTGLMSPKDDYRLLVVDNLKNAKELKLVVRTLALPGSWTRFYWYDPTFYR